MKLSPQSIKKIAVFRALQLGDMLCAVPAIRALRKAYPGAEITLLGLPWAQSFVERFNHYFDRFIHFPGCEGLPEQDYAEERLRSFIKQMKKEKFDLVLQMQGNGTIVNAPAKFFFASSASEGLNLIKFLLPDFVFIDINMPAINGLECLDLIADDKDNLQRSIIIYSTTIDNNVRNNAIKRGATACIKKQNTIHELAKLLKIFLSTKQS